MASMNPQKVKALLSDLGKPTMRGIRKCPKCGVYNGTRGISCKNKFCNVVFKEREKKQGNTNIESVKVITGSNVQVYSVRLRDSGPDYRSFVQLPVVQDLDGNLAETVEPEILAPAAQCYVENCHRPQIMEGLASACSHISTALKCRQEAIPLNIKNSVLESMCISTDLKNEISLLASETTGPLVQRVTKGIFVVKCTPSAKNPLGFLHFSFLESNRGRGVEHKYQCLCKSFKASKGDAKHKSCVHLYACLSAFVSDESLTREFTYYLNLSLFNHSADPGVDKMLPFYGSLVESDIREVSEAEAASLEVVVQDEHEFLAELQSDLCELKPAKKENSLDVVSIPDGLVGGQSPVKLDKTTPTKKSGSNQIDENEVQVGFHDWLASVTERINQTMHYQFDGSPDPLVFHAPQLFFSCLQQRISAGLKKKRLPNFTKAFNRKDALPLGLFTKYTWHITNILHLKQIFDTAQLPLEITRSFVENHDGTFEAYEKPADCVEKGPGARTPIRPFELKTYLKVGNTSPDQMEPTPFVIEWIPDILPVCKIGELRIKFQYGHQRNGHIERRAKKQTF